MTNGIWSDLEEQLPVQRFLLIRKNTVNGDVVFSKDNFDLVGALLDHAVRGRQDEPEDGRVAVSLQQC